MLEETLLVYFAFDRKTVHYSTASLETRIVASLTGIPPREFAHSALFCQLSQP